MEKQTAGRDALGTFAPKFAQLNDDVLFGEVWSRESIATLKKQVEDAGLNFDVIESIPVHEDIKLGKPSRDKYIENYCENIRRVAEAGVKCICYNFMPVFDWTRTQLDHELEDGVLILGGGAGFHSKSILSSLYGFNYAFDETQKVLQKGIAKKHHHENDDTICPRAIKLADVGKMVYMGFCKIYKV